MIKKLTLTLAVFGTCFCAELSAQSNQTVYFSGQGRVLFSNEGLKDQTNKASELRASDGYTMMDLGIYAEPDEVLRGSAILRIRNEFGGFFDNGSSIEFRQLQLEGLIADKVKYEFGDIYIDHTPYTLWNEEVISHDHEAGIFGIRRDIVNYENFFVDNKWRMQGVNTKAQINFEKGVESLGIRAYGGRTQETDFATIPDRYFFGGRLDLTQSKNFRLAGNLSGISDIPGTVEEAQVEYDNLVYTSDFDVDIEAGESFAVNINGEAGASNFELARASDSTKNSFEDFFYDVGAEATYNPLNLTLGVSYRDVGFNFNSPMAQTRRIANASEVSPTFFPTMNDDVTARPVTLFDRYAQETGLYNQSISTTLMSYFVPYDMVEPYGRATPNRQGITISADMEEPNNLFKASAEVNLLNEVASEGDSVTQKKRDFRLITGGVDLNVHEIVGFEKDIIINSGVRLESSTRGGTNPIDLSSTLIDLGLDVEVIKDLHLLGGMKMFSAKGEELIHGRDELNQIVSYGPVFNVDITSNIYALGLRYDYDNNTYFAVQANQVDYQDKEIDNMQFDLNQLFFVFGLEF